MRAVVTLLAAPLLLAACGGGHLPGPHARPTSAAGCNDLPLIDGDPGFLIGFDWSGEHHAYAERAPVDVCVTVGGGAVVRLSAPSGVRVVPVVRRVPAASTGVVRFHLVVSPGATGPLRLREGGVGGGFDADIGGPRIVDDGDGWHLTEPAS